MHDVTFSKDRKDCLSQSRRVQCSSPGGSDISSVSHHIASCGPVGPEQHSWGRKLSCVTALLHCSRNVNVTACSACSLRHVLVREVKLALLQHYACISPLLPARDCLEQGWEVLALCGVVHMHLHPVACVEAVDNLLWTITSSCRAKEK